MEEIVGNVHRVKYMEKNDFTLFTLKDGTELSRFGNWESIVRVQETWKFLCKGKVPDYPLTWSVKSFEKINSSSASNSSAEPFAVVEIGRRVACDIFGPPAPGTIETLVRTTKEGRNKFNVKFDNGFRRTFYTDGRMNLADPRPTLKYLD